MAPKRSVGILRTACVQLGAGSDWKKGLESALNWADKASRKADCIAFPENFISRGPKEFLEETASLGFRKTISTFKKIALRYRKHFLLGSLAEVSSKGRYYNTSVWISDKGNVAGRYRKMHLFDVALPRVKVQESKYFDRGKKTVMVDVRSGIRAGLSICYDLRFPELYRQLSCGGTTILFVPANFTYETGKAHWEVLLRARAIENQCYVVAPAQVGISPSNGIKSYGNSLIVSPWGEILARGSESGQEILTADLDFRALSKLRTRFPSLSHRSAYL